MTNKSPDAVEEAINTTSTILGNHPIKRGALFGSFARGSDTESSDLDILIEPDYSSGFSYLDLVRLEREISKAVGKKVDLLTFNSLNPHLKTRVLNEAKTFYER